jgi:uncharacterized protein YjbI with pentapeptide repeats
MAGLSFMDVFASDDPYDLPALYGYDFSDCSLMSSTLRNAWFFDCKFDRADVSYSDLVDTGFERCSLAGARFEHSVLSRARFEDCSFDRAILAYSAARETTFSRCSFAGADLSHMSLVRADMTGSALVDAYVYGVSAWDVTTEQTVQRGLVATRSESRERYGQLDEDEFFNEAIVTVGSLEVAQFVNLLLNNPKVRDAIDTITSRVVLILGRFTAERKAVLDRIRDDLGRLGYVPVLFGFRWARVPRRDGDSLDARPPLPVRRSRPYRAP